MKVLMIANSTGCYGANNSMIDMIVALKKRGVEFLVLLPERGEIMRTLRKENIDYYIIPYMYSSSRTITFDKKIEKFVHNISLLSEVKTIIKERGIDLIHTNASNVDLGALLSIICKIPHVWHVRELLYDDFKLRYDFPWMEKMLMHHADYLVAVSKYVALKRKLGENHVVIYNGLNRKKYEISKRQIFSDDVIHLLYCGQITKEKGVMDAVKAVQKIVKQGYKNVKLEIVGENNEYCRKVLNYIHRNELREYVIYYGHQHNMRPFRERADIALMCSRSEALGRVTIESMLGECLVIGANSGGTVELIDDGQTGYLYEAGNVCQLAQKILWVYQQGEWNGRILRNAKQFAQRQFDNNIYAGKILHIYNQCLNQMERT